MREQLSRVLTEWYHGGHRSGKLHLTSSQIKYSQPHTLTSTSIYAERSVIPRLYKVRIPLRERAGLFFMYLLPSHIESRYIMVRMKVGR